MVVTVTALTMNWRIAMSEYVSVGDVARRLGVRPAQITDLFYKRLLRDDLCPIVAGRRLIPPDYVEIIAAELRRKGIAVPRLGVAVNGGEACPR